VCVYVWTCGSWQNYCHFPYFFLYACMLVSTLEFPFADKNRHSTINLLTFVIVFVFVKSKFYT
jgi:hypothetical protein